MQEEQGEGKREGGRKAEDREEGRETEQTQLCEKCSYQISLTLFSLELQHSIISTIYFLTEFYSYRPTIHLRNMYLRWNLGKRGGRG